MKRSPVIDQLARHGVVPVIRFARTASARQAVDLLYRAGFRTFEITLSVPDADDLIAELAAREDLLVGVGTVLRVEDAVRALAAGARYVVTPVLLPELVPVCREAGAACLLSGLTPTEVMAAWDHGADAVKVFPASSMGGPGHVAALKSVLPHVTLVPTGGVNRDNLTAFLNAGAACVGAGGDLISDRTLERSDPDDAVRHARSYLEAFQRWTDKETA